MNSKGSNRNSYYSLFMLNEREQILDLVKQSVGSQADLSGLMKKNSSNGLLPKRGHSRSMPSKTSSFELKRPQSTQAKSDTNSEIRIVSHPMKVKRLTGSAPVAAITTQRSLPRSWNAEEAKPPRNEGVTSVVSFGMYFLVLACYLLYYFLGSDIAKSA